MKAKLIQIALGAIGAALSAVIQYVATGAADPALSAVGGASVSAVVSGFAARAFA